MLPPGPTPRVPVSVWLLICPPSVDVTQYFTLFCTDRAVIYGSTSGRKEFYPLTPEKLTCDLSGLPPVFIGSALFMFGRIRVVTQIEGCRAACVVVEKSWCVCWCGTSVRACVCVARAERQRGVLLSLHSFGLEEGSRVSGEQRGERSATPAQRV